MSEAHKRNLAVPFFTQRDNSYIWQRKKENGQIWKDDNGNESPKYPMAWRSCNITSLCMILHYWGITEDTPDQMMEKSFVHFGWNHEEYVCNYDAGEFRGGRK